jgi:hypothetical protein
MVVYIEGGTILADGCEQFVVLQSPTLESLRTILPLGSNTLATKRTSIQRNHQKQDQRHH